MLIQVLGTGCPNCRKLTENTQAAVASLGLDATIEKVEDVREIAKFRVMRTPALAVDGKVVLSGKVASPAEIATLLKG
ncbi:MAG: thioredoxin family protein [Armatimonadetes bacterium]|jgi:small redox-active disulfide protein 2|nr:thioredoxin family protein [Armatimonadota bacterium]